MGIQTEMTATHPYVSSPREVGTQTAAWHDEGGDFETRQNWHTGLLLGLTARVEELVRRQEEQRAWLEEMLRQQRAIWDTLQALYLQGERPRQVVLLSPPVVAMQQNEPEPHHEP
jgi:hypothetical protein